MATVELRLRPHQRAAWDAETRFSVRVWHRRAGKTFFTIARMLARAVEAPVNDWRAFYVAPTRVQAKAISWDYLKRWVVGLPGIYLNESELRVDLPNGARIQLLGAENYENLRGRWADDLVLDETAHIPSAAWTQVLSPMLVDRKGRATVIGTPNGRQNLFFDLWEYAGGDDGEWSRSLLTWEDTQVLDPIEIARQRRLMSEAEFAQEFLCSWDAALKGAYYAKEMQRADVEQRVTTVPHDPAFPVTVAVDLGWSDGMACTFWQRVGAVERCILSREYHMTTIPEIVADWRQLGFPVDEVVLPHDAKVHELGTGKTRQEVFQSLGCRTTLAPNIGLHEGIEAVRLMLRNAMFDRDGTKFLREALVSYRSAYDEVKGVHSMKPVHDWSSHMADSVRYYATGKRDLSAVFGPQRRLRGGTYA